MLEKGAGLAQQADGEPGLWREPVETWATAGLLSRTGAGEEKDRGWRAGSSEEDLKKVSCLQQGHSIRKQSAKVLFPALLPPFPIFLASSPEN